MHCCQAYPARSASGSSADDRSRCLAGSTRYPLHTAHCTPPQPTSLYADAELGAAATTRPTRSTWPVLSSAFFCCACHCLEQAMCLPTSWEATLQTAAEETLGRHVPVLLLKIAGMLSQFGYKLLPDEQKNAADLWLINTCTVCSASTQRRTSGKGVTLAVLSSPIQTLWCLIVQVKSPSQSSCENVISLGRNMGKKMLIAGCVPQGAAQLCSAVLSSDLCWCRSACRPH